MRIRINPYLQGSRSAKALATALDGKVLKLKGSKYKYREGDIIINWGSSNCPFPKALNNPKAIACASNKREFFHAMEGKVTIPPFCTTKKGAAELQFPVVCRTKLTGHSGEGIVIANTPEELVEAPLYTQYVKKKDEYRVHVLAGKAFYVQRKARKHDVENPDWRIRNLANGFVFVEADVAEVPKDVITNSVRAIAASGLDFGGVDVIWNQNEGKAYVLEINTACGLEERTADQYAKAFLHSFQN